MASSNQNLSAELLEKAKACTSPEELEGLLEEESVELPIEALDVVAGGMMTDEEFIRMNSAELVANARNHVNPSGDSREDIDSGRVPTDFASGDIDGSAFF